MSRLQRAEQPRKKKSPSSQSLREARDADRDSRHHARGPLPFVRCSGCGDLVAPTNDPRRPGGTAVHHVASGERCLGSDLPFDAHGEALLASEPNVYLLTPAAQRQEWRA